ncbi:MAG: Transposase [Parcubacteria group bacterium GW2011_GWC1_36_9]|uniref:Transposase n=1 Tax=Candidatus Yanofskybacteria bacterium GW2011_GWC2_37_9 TaxID=1619028 RepID=A0A0G0KZ65_9BACT|nr:MAG: Transposase [Parcubacteria group bacterium GW2011_GWC1_36_9]KKQ45761.1 MAG: Transposase [Candidatus Yanofskybacteria bacterium GW2011_GWC2_37_9]
MYNINVGRNLVFVENEYYHIYNRGVEKRKIFLDEGDHKRFVFLLLTANSSTPVHLSNYKGLSLLEIPKGEPLVSIGAWCIMPNHFHLLLKEIKKDGISLFMKKLLTGYSMYFNTKYHHKGTLFEGTFSAKHLDTDNYLKYQYAYIHLNPIGIIDDGWKEKKIKNIKKAKDFLFSYGYSSFQDYMGIKRDENNILSIKAFPGYFESFVDFKEMVNEWLNIKDYP